MIIKIDNLMFFILDCTKSSAFWQVGFSQTRVTAFTFNGFVLLKILLNLITQSTQRSRRRRGKLRNQSKIFETLRSLRPLREKFRINFKFASCFQLKKLSAVALTHARSESPTVSKPRLCRFT